MLSKKQLEFLQNPLSRINLLYGSVRSGKTYISLLKWALWIGQQNKTDEFLMVGKTVTALKRNCLGLLETLIGDNITYSISQKKAVIFGRTVWLEGANDERAESKIRGMTLKGCYIDELTQIPRAFYLMTLSRLSMANAALIATTNPDAPTHYVKTEIIDNEEINKQVVKYMLDDNSFLDAEYKENLKKEYKGVFYDRFILGEFVRAEGIIFRDLAEHKEDYICRIDEVPKNCYFVEMGFDIGGNGSAYAQTCTLQAKDGTLYVLKAKKTQPQDLKMEDIEKLVCEFGESIENIFDIYPKYINSDHVDVIINGLNDHTKYSCSKCYKPPLEDRVFLISKLLAQHKIKFVEGMCDDLINEMQNLVFDDKSERAIPLDDGSMQIDTWDSFIYSISSNWKYIDYEVMK